MSTEEIHSHEYLFEQREEWWNADYISLLANRWDLVKYNSIVDIGVGLGSWSRLLLPYLKEPFNFTGVDKEEYWLEQAPKYFYSEFPQSEKSSFSFVLGDAQSLPLESDSYDVVTCQTLLMHLQNPLAALLEMKRILKKGGILICVEPINLLNRLEFSTASSELPIEHNVSIYKFFLHYHSGKIINGKGNNDIGVVLPSLFKQAGFTQLQSYQNDKLMVSSEFSEISIDENTTSLAIIGGADNKIIQDAIIATENLNRIISNLSESNKYTYSGLMNMLICSGMKT